MVRKNLELNVVVAWHIGPRMDGTGVDLVIEHLPLGDALAKKKPNVTALALTPPQADMLSEELVKARWKSQPGQKPEPPKDQ